MEIRISLTGIFNLFVQIQLKEKMRFNSHIDDSVGLWYYRYGLDMDIQRTRMV